VENRQLKVLPLPEHPCAKSDPSELLLFEAITVCMSGWYTSPVASAVQWNIGQPAGAIVAAIPVENISVSVSPKYAERWKPALPRG
jgi:hypothetical protein